MIEKTVRDDVTEIQVLQIGSVLERSPTDVGLGSAVYLDNVIPAVIARLANIETPVTILSPYLTADVAQQLLTGKNAEHM